MSRRKQTAKSAGGPLALLLALIFGVAATNHSPDVATTRHRRPAVASQSPTPAVSAPAVPSVEPGGDVACGVERWSVKTGTDADAAKVDLTPVATTIAAIDKFAFPVNPPANGRLGSELKTYTVHAVIDAYKGEADSDYHLAIRDGLDTMIAEIPAPGCLGTSIWRPQIEAARAEFDAHLHATGSFKTSDVAVTITGVLFADKLHGQRGAAPQGYELHPVLAISFG